MTYLSSIKTIRVGYSLLFIEQTEGLSSEDAKVAEIKGSATAVRGDHLKLYQYHIIPPFPFVAMEFQIALQAILSEGCRPT
jgi:hypothetical protein